MNFKIASLALREHGLGWPRFVIDLGRLDANIARIRPIATADRLRLVVKSLPCRGLIERIMAQTGTRKLMVFHLPFLIQAVRHWPHADLLLGKPLPAAAVQAFYRFHQPQQGFDPARQLHWLVDTPARAAAHAAIARRFGTTLSVVIELDVGMHRGGVARPDQLEGLLGAIAAEHGALRLAGFMGYDAHAGKTLPWMRPLRAVGRANRRYAALLETARRLLAGDLPAEWIINGSGSPTCVLHGAESPLNELAIGSLFLKPVEFDLPQLAHFEPACWIAAPIIKRLSGVRLPHLEWLSGLSRRDTVFIYGGRWPARPEWPRGLRPSRLYGPSFNQQFFTVPKGAGPGVDEFVFFRPLQSERVLHSMGDVVVVSQRAQPIDQWSVLTHGDSALNELDSCTAAK